MGLLFIYSYVFEKWMEKSNKCQKNLREFLQNLVCSGGHMCLALGSKPCKKNFKRFGDIFALFWVFPQHINDIEFAKIF